MLCIVETINEGQLLMKDGEHMDVCCVEMLSQLWSDVSHNNAYWRNVLLLWTAALDLYV